MRTELLIGCGSKRIKDRRLMTWKEIEMIGRTLSGVPGRLNLEFENLVTLDKYASHNPDITFDLTWIGTKVGRNHRGFIVDIPTPWKIPLPSGDPTPDNTYDEIHAYEVLEHIGAQGDAKLFFDQFTEFHRILKPGGLMFASCPSWHSPWAWGDPSHTRILTVGTLSFLSQIEYAKQVGVTPMSDFRSIYKADFEVITADESTDTFLFIIKAIK